MIKASIAVHGGIGKLNPYVLLHRDESYETLKKSLLAGQKLLNQGKSALKAVEAALVIMEDCPLYNAGRGSALNKMGEVEMDASIMSGKHLTAGAVSLVRQVKNPIILASKVMQKTNHVYISGEGTLELAKLLHLPLEDESYFLTEHQQISHHGTVGAVAIDCNGNLASGTTTGGISHQLRGRVGDSCIIGAGCYADNRSCAVSCTGDGEYIITRVVAHTIAMMHELKNEPLQIICDHVIHTRNKKIKATIGVIAIDKNSELGIAFNTPMMRYGYVGGDGTVVIHHP